jgi:hypothetical protein
MTSLAEDAISNNRPESGLLKDLSHLRSGNLARGESAGLELLLGPCANVERRPVVGKTNHVTAGQRWMVLPMRMRPRHR